MVDELGKASKFLDRVMFHRCGKDIITFVSTQKLNMAKKATKGVTLLCDGTGRERRSLGASGRTDVRHLKYTTRVLYKWYRHESASRKARKKSLQ